ncbi:MAG: AEC family transporter [Pseudomonadota bacterium]
MNLALQVLEIVAPVFLLAALGFGWVRLGYEYRVEFVTRLAMTLAIPCLIFTALVESAISPAILADMALATLTAYAAAGLGIALAIRVFGLAARTFWAPLTFGNTGNLGLPLALFAFGDTGLGLAAVVFSLTAVLGATLGVWVVAGGGPVWKALQEPMTWGSVLGALCLALGYTPPVWAMNTLGLVGQMGIPLMLISLGVAISRLVPAAILRAVALSLLKLGLCLPVGIGAAMVFGLDTIATSVLILQISMPVAVMNYMMAEKYGADAAEVAGLVVISTLLAVITIPAILAVFVG